MSGPQTFVSSTRIRATARAAARKYVDDVVAAGIGEALGRFARELQQQITALEAKVVRLTSIVEQNTFKGHWEPNKAYSRGNYVTHGGAIHHCNIDGTQAKPGSDPGAWTLAVARGRDGKDSVTPHEPPVRTTRTSR